MRTITFATTQMNLINCAEYLSTVEGEHTLVVDSVSIARKRQMLKLLENEAYSCLFSNVVTRAIKDNRIWEFLNTLFYLIRMVLLSRTKQFDQVVSGNYLCFGSRVFYASLSNVNRKAKYVACDDGSGTITVAKNRANEISSQTPMLYIPSRIYNWMLKKKPKVFIPEEILYFTNYDIVPTGKDRVVHHNYAYLKEHISDFNVDSSIFECEAILLGEPLYFKNFVSEECYAKKLKSYAETVEGKIVYYAHPEEIRCKWELLGVMDKYIYVDNFLPFEVISAILPEGCRVATFVSSVLMNIKEVNNTLIPECITFKQEEVFAENNYDNVLLLYGHYQNVGVKFYEFS